MSIAWSMHVEYLAFVALVAAYVTGWAVWILTLPGWRRRRRAARRRRQIRRRDDRLAQRTRCDLSRLDVGGSELAKIEAALDSLGDDR